MAAEDNLLLATLRACAGNSLLVADENCPDFPFASLAGRDLEVLSNRFDIADAATRAGLRTRFSDFDFSPWRQQPPGNIVFRVSKEKAVVHHIANSSCRLLPEGGRLILLGGKQEGIKTFAKTLGTLFGTPAMIDKEGASYRVTATKAGGDCGPALADRNYEQLREIGRFNDAPIYSKPGQFGWDKVDKGSALLAGYLPSLVSSLSLTAGDKVLDLGCGYGYLSIAISQLGAFAITATDNCAAAIVACKRNFSEFTIDGEVIADDCALGISSGYSLVVCNPPFHQGFSQDRRLTEKFLSAARRLLRPGGRALFVVNGFVPLESLAAPHFSTVEVPRRDNSFKLVLAG